MHISVTGRIWFCVFNLYRPLCSIMRLCLQVQCIFNWNIALKHSSRIIILQKYINGAAILNDYLNRVKNEWYYFWYMLMCAKHSHISPLCLCINFILVYLIIFSFRIQFFSLNVCVENVLFLMPYYSWSLLTVAF